MKLAVAAAVPAFAVLVAPAAAAKLTPAEVAAANQRTLATLFDGLPAPPQAGAHRRRRREAGAMNRPQCRPTVAWTPSPGARSCPSASGVKTARPSAGS